MTHLSTEEAALLKRVEEAAMKRMEELEKRVDEELDKRTEELEKRMDEKLRKMVEEEMIKKMEEVRKKEEDENVARIIENLQELLEGPERKPKSTPTGSITAIQFSKLKLERQPDDPKSKHPADNIRISQKYAPKKEDQDKDWMLALSLKRDDVKEFRKMLEKVVQPTDQMGNLWYPNLIRGVLRRGDFAKRFPELVKGTDEFWLQPGDIVREDREE